MAIQTIPVIEIDGSGPKQRGRCYGEEARPLIHTIIDVYREIFQLVTGRSWQENMECGKPILAMARSFAADLIEEIEGIAEGAGLPFEDVFLLNARSEILYNPVTLSQECTTLAVLPEAARNGDMFMAQNWDWYKEVVDCQVILKIGGQEGRPSIITFTEAGQLSKIGMNGNGIGLLVNNLLSDQPRCGVPWILITRRVLESTSIAQALGYIMDTQRAHSLNFLVGTAEGETVDVETSPVEANMLWPENGCLAHTNHYVRKGKNFADLKPLRTPYLSTYLRLRRAKKGLQKLHPNIEVEGIREILSDHFERPFSICAHEKPSTESMLQNVTCLAIIMNMSQKQIHYCRGNPCEGIFQTIGF